MGDGSQEQQRPILDDKGVVRCFARPYGSLCILGEVRSRFFKMSRSSVMRVSSRFNLRISEACSSSPEPAGFENFFFQA